MNVVSLVPSGTELLAAIGVEPVAISHHCEYPSNNIPTMSRRAVDVKSASSGSSASSATIHRDVANAATDDIHAIDLESLQAVDPDVILTQGLCSKCTVDTELVRRAVSELKITPEIVSLTPTDLESILQNIRTIGDAINETERTERFIADLRARLDTVKQRLRGAADHPRVVAFEWLDPLKVSALWVPDIVRHAGGKYGLATAGNRSRKRDWETIVEYDPEVIVAAPCGFSLERTKSSLSELTCQDGWDDLTAVQNNRVYAMDGQTMNHHNHNVIDAIEALASVLHPTQFDLSVPDTIVKLPS